MFEYNHSHYNRLRAVLQEVSASFEASLSALVANVAFEALLKKRIKESFIQTLN